MPQKVASVALANGSNGKRNNGSSILSVASFNVNIRSGGIVTLFTAILWLAVAFKP